jgi:hypothetical protein
MPATSDPSRWAAFTPEEQELIRYSVTLGADSLDEDVKAGEVYAADLETATTTAAAARSLADEIGNQRAA